MSIRGWLQADHLPTDLFEFLGWPRSNLNREQLFEAVRHAYAELLPYQNHTDKRVAERAMKLQRQLGRAADVLSDPVKFQAGGANMVNLSFEETLRRDDDQIPSIPDLGGQAIAESCGREQLPHEEPSSTQELLTLPSAPGWLGGRRRFVGGIAMVVVAAAVATWIWLRIAPNSLQQTFPGHGSSVTCLELSPDGLLLASGGEDKMVMLWDVTTGVLRHTLEGHSGTINSLAFSADGLFLASASNDKTVKLWDTATGGLRKTLIGHQRGVTSVAFRPTGSYLASASDDGTIRLWDVLQGQQRRTFEGHQGGVTAVVFSPDGSLLASGGDDKTVRLWEVATGSSRKVLEGHKAGIRTVTFKDGATLFSAGWDQTVRLWSVARGELRETLLPPGTAFTSVALSPNGVTLALGNKDNTVTLWDLTTGEVQQTLAGHRDRAMCMAFSRDASLLATGSGTFDRTVRLWETGMRVAPSASLPPLHRHNQERFLEALRLTRQPSVDYRRALELLGQNIIETPSAEDVDYDYVWAAICCAHVGKFDDAYEYYVTVRTQFGRGPRNWTTELAEVKRLLAAANDPKAKQVYRRILDLERTLGGRQAKVP